MLKNSTNIPDQLVAVAVAFGMPPDCGERISSIVLKNKRRGKIKGQWGWYYSSDMRIVLVVPRKISMLYHGRKKYTKLKFSISSRAEFVVMVLAHEMRHAWQFKHWNTEGFKWKLAPTPMGRFAREVDAERYEIEVLKRWQAQFIAQKAASQL